MPCAPQWETEEEQKGAAHSAHGVRPFGTCYEVMVKTRL